MADKNNDIPFGYPGNPGFMQDSPFVPEPQWDIPAGAFMPGADGAPYPDAFAFPGFYGAPGQPAPMTDPGFQEPTFPDVVFPESGPGPYPIPMTSMQPMPFGYPDPSLAMTMPPMQFPPFPPEAAPSPMNTGAVSTPKVSPPAQNLFDMAATSQKKAEPAAQAKDGPNGTALPDSALQPSTKPVVPQVIPNAAPTGDPSQLPSRVDATGRPQIAPALRGAPAPGFDGTTLPLVQAKFDPNVGRMRNPEVEEKDKKRGFIIAIVILSVITVALAGALVYVLDPFGVFAKSEIDPPSEVQVENSFNAAYLPPPDLQPYAYINTADLERVSLSDFMAGEVNYDTTNNATDAYSQCTALATYKNDSVTVEQSLSLRLLFNRSDRSWQSNSATTISLNVIPIAAADIEAIIADFDKIMASYNESLANMYEGATYEVIPESKLTSDGGILNVVTKKTATDGTPLTCNIKCIVGWSNENGWVVKIDSVEGDVPPDLLQQVGDNDADAITPVETTTESIEPTTENAENANGEGETTEGEDGAGDQTQIAGDSSTIVQYRLTCPNGAKVKVPGTIEIESGRTLLRTFGLMEVILAGRTYTVDYFEITGGQGFETGQGVEVCGIIGTGGALEKAPLIIKIG